MKVRARQLRRSSTSSEALLWAALRRRGLVGAKWRRQHVIGRFVVDFYSAELGVVIEVDGAIHEVQVAADSTRQRALETAGLRVVRVPAAEVEHDLDAVLARLRILLSPPRAT